MPEKMWKTSDGHSDIAQSTGRVGWLTLRLDPDLSKTKSRDGHPALNLHPTRFWSRYYPPRDISPILDKDCL